MSIKFTGESAKNDKDFELIPDSRQTVVVDEVSKEQAKTGTEYYKVRFSVSGGKYDNRKVWRNFFLTEKAVVFIEELLNAIDPSIVKENESISDEKFKDSVLGKQLTGYISTTKSDQDGKDYQYISKFKPATGGTTKVVKKRSTAEVEEEGDIFS